MYKRRDTKLSPTPRYHGRPQCVKITVRQRRVQQPGVGIVDPSETAAAMMLHRLQSVMVRARRIVLFGICAGVFPLCLRARHCLDVAGSCPPGEEEGEGGAGQAFQGVR